jgi:putative transposase
MQEAITDLAPVLGVAEACHVFEVPRSTYYRGQPSSTTVRPAQARRRSGRALSSEDRSQLRDSLDSERFAASSPREVYAPLLDEGRYLCSWPTMYRILREADEVRRRRDQARQSSYGKPE